MPLPLATRDRAGGAVVCFEPFIGFYVNRTDIGRLVPRCRNHGEGSDRKGLQYHILWCRLLVQLPLAPRRGNSGDSY